MPLCTSHRSPAMVPDSTVRRERQWVRGPSVMAEDPPGADGVSGRRNQLPAYPNGADGLATTSGGVLWSKRLDHSDHVWFARSIMPTNVAHSIGGSMDARRNSRWVTRTGIAAVLAL